MSFSYVGSINAYTAGATELDWSGSFATGTLLVAVYAFQSVAPGSGPWSVPNVGQLANTFVGPATGWAQVGWQAPSATGVGIEVWCAINGPPTVFTRKLAFAVSQQVQLSLAGYSGAYAPNGTISDGAVRASATATVTGNNPAAPSITANGGELVVACGGDLMTGAGFGTPSGFTSRIDAAGGGAGNVEATVADATVTVPGATGLIVFPEPAASTSTAGATATLAIVPTPATPGAGGIINAGLPEGLDVGSGYTLRVTALDPTTGNPVSGVTVSNLIFTADQISGTPEGLEVGPFMLVPGPNDA